MNHFGVLADEDSEPLTSICDDNDDSANAEAVNYEAENTLTALG